MVLEMIGSVSMIAGSLFGVVGAIGLLRFPDFYTRIHAAGVTDSLCAILVIGGLMLLASSWLIAVKLLMVLFFLLFTTPTASYALARAALRAGFRPQTSNSEGNA